VEKVKDATARISDFFEGLFYSSWENTSGFIRVWTYRFMVMAVFYFVSAVPRVWANNSTAAAMAGFDAASTVPREWTWSQYLQSIVDARLIVSLGVGIAHYWWYRMRPAVLFTGANPTKFKGAKKSESSSSSDVDDEESSDSSSLSVSDVAEELKGFWDTMSFILKHALYFVMMIAINFVAALLAWTLILVFFNRHSADRAIPRPGQFSVHTKYSNWTVFVAEAIVGILAPMFVFMGPRVGRWRDRHATTLHIKAFLVFFIFAYWAYPISQSSMDMYTTLASRTVSSFHPGTSVVGFASPWHYQTVLAYMGAHALAGLAVAFEAQIYM
jgi:hypothetical protein